MGRSVSLQLWFLLLVFAVTAACGQNGTTPVAPGPGPDPGPEPLVTAVLVGAADIAQCDNDGGRPAEATARLLDGIEGTVFAAGDLAYYRGSDSDFANCYDKSWGRHKRRTRPSPGNHEYETGNAEPYFRYFGSNAGDCCFGFYSYTLGRWHVVSLNSNVPLTLGSEQYVWLQDDLTFNRPACTVVYFHHPRFTSGPSNGGFFRDAWQLMYSLGVDVIINGHDHGYERFGPQTPEGVASPTGIRQFIVGTGGASLYAFGARANSQVRHSTYGVLKLTLRNRDYDWDFIEATTGRILDHDTDRCH